MSKVIGILGGYGPYATASFYQQILSKTPAEKDWDHFHIIIDSNPKIPSRARAFLFNEPSPLPDMIKGIERLKNAGADFFVCPCNSAHYFLKSQDKFPILFVDMVEAVVDEINELGIKRVGLIGSEVTIDGEIYQNELNSKGSDISLLPFNDLKKVREIIEAGKTGNNLKSAKQKLIGILKGFKQEDVEAVIYGCTELPLILPSNLSPVPIIDTADVLIEKAILIAKEN